MPLRTIDIERIMSRNATERYFGVQIKPCPFCGNPECGLFDNPIAHITCRVCGCDGPVVEEPRGGHERDSRYHKAILLWNGRRSG